MVSCNPEVGLIILVSDLHGVSSILEMSALRGLRVATVENAAISAAVYKGGVELSLLTEMR